MYQRQPDQGNQTRFFSVPAQGWEPEALVIELRGVLGPRGSLPANPLARCTAYHIAMFCNSQEEDWSVCVRKLLKPNVIVTSGRYHNDRSELKVRGGFCQSLSVSKGGGGSLGEEIIAVDGCRYANPAGGHVILDANYFAFAGNLDRSSAGELRR
jgi:hypothetical protein